MSPYEFPSGEQPKFDLSQIEGPLRREKRKAPPDWCLWALVALLVLVSYWVVGKFVDTQHVQAQEQIEVAESQWSSFCVRATADHTLTGTAASEDLKNLCK